MKRESAPHLHSAIHREWSDPTYRHNAQKLQQAMAATDGVARVPDIVEQVINSGLPTRGSQLAKAVVSTTPHDHPDERRAVQ